MLRSRQAYRNLTGHRLCTETQVMRSPAASPSSSNLELARYLSLRKSGYLSRIIEQRDHHPEFAASELLDLDKNRLAHVPVVVE
jgi:hypothetical protein